ncbi:YafY family protein [Marinovum sp. 2_MG-2023]|uniref:helix-turn-helix transcriptional regulator n=1 Tax=unclassified Marinovum TaxID=2647166 RepID=UPI0026E42652|nr:MULTISPECIES: YafY family protein [unclassified Marinovum]MDO6732330.1 YafY family protein [Marinovum sp. 2_MG-2023]MDO6781647.1 YafY family protein [Marinovum sp. 1_MG-2023]
MTRTQRLFQLMQALRSLPAPVTAAELADEMSVDPRTIYRDINTLREMGAVIDGAAGYGYTMIEDHALPPMGFENDELEALVLGLREVQEIGDPTLAKAAGQALTKLRARLPDKQAHRLRHAVLHVHHFHEIPKPGVDAAVLRRATWDEMRIRFAYRDKDGNATTREADPLTISYFQMSHCLLAFCQLRQDFRAFRLDRMTDLEVLDISFRPRRVPMLRDYMALLKAGTERHKGGERQ